MSYYLIGGSKASSRRPLPKQQLSLVPPLTFAGNSSGGNTYTTFPPEWNPPKNYDPLFMRGDFNGVTLDMTRWTFTIPTLIGSNTTPINMLMTPMSILYPQNIIDALLTEHAERNYSHFVIAPDGWNLEANGFTPTPANITAYAKYIKSWGFFVVLWRSVPTYPDPFLSAMLEAGVVDYYIIGEEIDGKMTSAQLTAQLNSMMSDGIPVPIGVHFSTGAAGAYPLRAPLDDYLTDWSPYNGKVHLCLQLNQDQDIGTRGALLYYARMRVQLGWVGDGTYSNPAPLCRVHIFENDATNELMGSCSELQGCLDTYQLLCCPSGSPGISFTSGFCNGARLPNGLFI